MGANPFDELGAALEALRNEVRNLATSLEPLRNGLHLAAVMARIDALAAPRPEWEEIADAAAARRKGRGQLLRAIKDGTVAARRVPGPGGHGKWLLSVADLDKHFPVLAGAGRKKKNQGRNPGSSDPEGSCPAAPSYRTDDTVAELFG